MATQTETILANPPRTHTAPEPLAYTEAAPEDPPASRSRKFAVPLLLAGINFTFSCSNGLVVIGLPQMTEDLALPPSLAFWPASVSSLATASTILLAGSVADSISPKTIDLLGSFLGGVMMLGSGFVRSGEQLVILRAFQGIGLAMHLPSSISLVTMILARGKGRNLAFACLGLSQPLGFCFGLIIGGVLVDTIGWRTGWYLYGAITLLFTTVNLWSLPKSMHLGIDRNVLHDLKTRVDWPGALLASASLTLLCYYLASISADVHRAKDPGSIVIILLSIITIGLFIAWGHRQSKRSRPALIPHSFWQNGVFTSICITIAASFGVVNSLELFASLFFQEVQGLPSLQAAIRLLPSLMVGVFTNVMTGMFVHKLPAVSIVVITALLSAVAPLLMAVVQPAWPYWANAFIAQLLIPINCNTLFTVGMIIITDIFPKNKQSPAGAIFNTASQFGNAVGYSVMQVISALVAQNNADMRPSQALMEGYRAAFWTMLSMMLSSALISWFGLRKTGKVGSKED